MDKIENMIKNMDEEKDKKVNWTKAWSVKYSILKTYQNEVDTNYYKKQIRILFEKLKSDYNYNELDSMLVLKDILAHEYLDK